MMKHDTFDPARRRLLRGAALAGGALAPMGALLAKAETRRRSTTAGYGPLRPVKDLTTGRELLTLPDGFRYRTMNWCGEPLLDGTPTPGKFDGMGVVAHDAGTITLVRNHECVDDRGHFGPARVAYDPVAAGGTVTLELDARDGTFRRAWPSLAGTLQNCAGGITPWGTWLSCEEYVHEEPTRPVAGGRDEAAKFLTRLTREHGFVFEVDPSGTRAPVAIEAMGQFRHEAAVVHAPTGDVYLTEDREPDAGFYRFVPTRRGDLAAGGTLQMLRAVGRRDLRRGLKVGQRFAVEWIDIGEPGRGHTPGTRDGRGVLHQGLAAGASAFTRLEGIHATDAVIHFTATNGGDAALGQVFAYDVRERTLTLLVESKGIDALDYPDNLTVSPRGGLVLCEDGKRRGQHLVGMTPSGELFPFAGNHVLLRDELRGFRGDFRDAEWAGVCFSPDGRFLVANVYDPGFTVVIEGPWRDGLI